MNTEEIIKDIVRIAIANHLNDAEEIDREELRKHTFVLQEKYGISGDQLEELTEEGLSFEGWHAATAEILSDRVDDLFDQSQAHDIIDSVLEKFASEYFREDLIELRDSINKWFETAIENAEEI